jgi:hypothetical protein
MNWKCNLCDHLIAVHNGQHYLQITRHEDFHNPNMPSFKDGSKRNVRLGKVTWSLVE